MVSAAPEAEIRDWLRAYVAENLNPERMIPLVDRLDSRIVSLVPGLADRELQHDLRASTVAQLRSLLVAFTDDEFNVVVPPEAHTLARTVARRGLEMRVLMHIYRAGQQAGTEYLADVITEQDLPYTFERAILLRLFELANKWLGISLELLTDTFVEERELSLRDVFTRRAETVRAILAGDATDTDTASRRLGYRLPGRHVAFVVWSDDAAADGDVITALDRVAASIAERVGATNKLTVPSGARGLWAWLSFDSATDLVDLRADRLADSSIRVALGGWGTGVAGFRRSHREAVAARAVAQSAGGSEWLTDYRDVELVHLLSADREGMRALISRELAGIDGQDVGSARLRQTLHVYLQCQRSPDAAAKVLGVHKNTVRYRIQRVEELLGHDVESRRLQLETALACAATYGVSG